MLLTIFTAVLLIPRALILKIKKMFWFVLDRVGTRSSVRTPTLGACLTSTRTTAPTPRPSSAPRPKTNSTHVRTSCPPSHYGSSSGSSPSSPCWGTPRCFWSCWVRIWTIKFYVFMKSFCVECNLSIIFPFHETWNFSSTTFKKLIYSLLHLCFVDKVFRDSTWDYWII